MSSIKGARIRQVRTHFNLSVEAWARLLGVSSSTAYRWEGTQAVNIERLQHELIETFATLPKQDLLADAVREAPLKLLWKLLGQVYGEEVKT